MSEIAFYMVLKQILNFFLLIGCEKLGGGRGKNSAGMPLCKGILPRVATRVLKRLTEIVYYYIAVNSLV